jgi:serine/threonine-protein kinase RsbW
MNEIRRAIDLAAEFCNRQDFAENDVNAVCVLLDEVLSNVILHGTGESKSREISVDVESSDSEITVTVEDDGAPFDPTSVPKPHFEPRLARRITGGLGLMFVRALSESVVYQRASNRNRLVLRRRLTGMRSRRPTQPGFRLSKTSAGACLLVTVEGRLDSEASRVLRDRLLEFVQTGSSRLVLDLSSVSYVGSAGIWALLAAQRRASALRGGLVIYGLSDDIRTLFEHTGIADALRVCDTRDEALEACSGELGI